GNIGCNCRTVWRSSSVMCAFIKRCSHLTPLVARPVDGQNAVSDLTGLYEVFGTHCSDIDWYIGTEWFEAQFEAAFEVEIFAVIDQFFFAEDHPENLDVLACAFHRLAKGKAMPVLNDIGSRGPKPQDDTPARALIQRGSAHGDQSRGARINIGNTGTNLDA